MNEKMLKKTWALVYARYGFLNHDHPWRAWCCFSGAQQLGIVLQ